MLFVRQIISLISFRQRWHDSLRQHDCLFTYPIFWDKWESSCALILLWKYFFYKCTHHFSWFYNFNLKLLQRTYPRAYSFYKRGKMYDFHAIKDWIIFSGWKSIVSPKEIISTGGSIKILKSVFLLNRNKYAFFIIKKTNQK